MKTFQRIYLAATAIAALAACMKAGDGVGMDPKGNLLPFCQVHPEAPSCAVVTDPCVTAPASAACSISLCAKDPTRAGCTVTDCGKTPAAQGCSVDVCTANPSAPECQPPTRFSEVYAIMDANSCLTCHLPGGLGVIQGKLNMASADSAYANLVGVNASVQSVARGWKRVASGKPDSSLLIIKLAAATTSVIMPDGKGYGARMPIGFSAVPAGDLTVIRKWIQDGALK